MADPRAILRCPTDARAVVRCPTDPRAVVNCEPAGGGGGCACASCVPCIIPSEVEVVISGVSMCGCQNRSGPHLGYRSENTIALNLPSSIIVPYFSRCEYQRGGIGTLTTEIFQFLNCQGPVVDILTYRLFIQFSFWADFPLIRNTHVFVGGFATVGGNVVANTKIFSGSVLRDPLRCDVAPPPIPNNRSCDLLAPFPGHAFGGVATVRPL